MAKKRAKQPAGTTAVPRFTGRKRTGTDYVPQGPGGRGTAETTAIVRKGKKAKRDTANAKAKRAALKGAKVTRARGGGRVSVRDAINPRTGDFRGGLRIQSKEGNVLRTSTGGKSEKKSAAGKVSAIRRATKR